MRIDYQGTRIKNSVFSSDDYPDIEILTDDPKNPHFQPTNDSKIGPDGVWTPIVNTATITDGPFATTASTSHSETSMASSTASSEANRLFPGYVQRCAIYTSVFSMFLGQIFVC